MNAPVRPLDAVGEIPPPGEAMQARLSIDAHAMKRLILDHKIAPQRELIEEARDALTDVLQWMDEHDG